MTTYKHVFRATWGTYFMEIRLGNSILKSAIVYSHTRQMQYKIEKSNLLQA